MKWIYAIITCLAIIPIHANATTVSVDGPNWKINDEITYPGAPAEGLLMNVRMVNSTFEDTNKPDFDPDENTSRFLSKLAEYNSFGVRAITLNLQGGFPGYEGAVNSAFQSDGSLRSEYMKRIKRVITACDKQGMIVILGLFYQRQDQILKDSDAIKRAVVNAIQWIQDNKLTNVVVEIANEFGHGGFDHPQIQTAEGELELIRLAKKTAPNLLVSTSGLGHGGMNEIITKEADFILIHFNGTKVENIPSRIQAFKKYNKPVVCNEDDKLGETAANALRASVANGGSWGFMHKEQNQFSPFEFNGYQDDPIVYDAFKEATQK
ncbi:hypothetical protein K8I31_06250 [bacterium]|nr:hypothetical protein [bacterium]